MKVKIKNLRTNQITFIQDLKIKESIIKKESLSIYGTDEPCVLERAYILKKITIEFMQNIQPLSSITGKELYNQYPCLDLEQNDIKINDKILFLKKYL